MTGPHLGVEDLLDVAEGTRPVPAHVNACVTCQRALADLRETMSAVAEVDVPEPSPLFWDHLSARVREAVGAEPRSRRRFPDGWAWALLPAGAVAIAVLAVVSGVSRNRPAEPAGDPPSRSAAAGIDARLDATPTPDPVVSDPSLELIADLSEGLDWDAATAAGWTTATASLDQAFDRLNEAERATLRQLLQDALSGKGA